MSGKPHRKSQCDPLGRRQTVTQLDSSGTSGGTVLDQAGFSYDGWSNVASYRQDVDSAFGGSGDDEYEVSYTWAKATGGRASLRRTGITLPSGASVSLDYRSANGRFDDAVSRVTTMSHGPTIVVSYDYLGAGQVVGTDYPEPEIRWRLYEGNTTGDYTDLDDFGRVVHSRWTKYGVLPYGMSPPNIYHVELGYDENSNITWAKDHVHAGFDVLYEIDGIDRLTRAEEGTLMWDTSAWVINDPTRDQQWTLDQVGNWNRDKLDLDGDGNFTGTDEWDDCRTHNDVNELLTRDLDCSSSADHTLAYDAAGNLIDDGKDYKYVYDAFYRLRFIKNQSDDVVSEHRYNGLGHRIAVHVDTDDDGDPDTWEHLAYDERWRLIARYWAGNSDPHEEFLHHQSGLDGHGGSSYIDLVALRDRDTDDNGSLDERVYYCQNWRADVSVLVRSDARPLEWVKYSAYGVPFGLPRGDADSDGDRNEDDRDQIDSWAFTSTYDVRGDLNLDGLVDSSDKVAASGDVEMGRGSTAMMGTTLGWAGGEHVVGVFSAVWFRNRLMLSGQGRWSRRDPLFTGVFNSGEGVNRYQSLMSSPMVLLDPFGLKTTHLVCDKGAGSGGDAPKEGSCKPITTEVSFLCRIGQYRWLYKAFDQDSSHLTSEKLCDTEVSGDCIRGTMHTVSLSCTMCCKCGNQKVCRVHGDAGFDDDDADGCADVVFVGLGVTGGQFGEHLDGRGSSTAEQVTVGVLVSAGGAVIGGKPGLVAGTAAGAAYTARNPSGASQKVCCPMEDCKSADCGGGRVRRGSVGEGGQ